MTEKKNYGYTPNSKVEKGYKPSPDTKKPNPQGGYKPTEGTGDNPGNKPPRKP